MVRIRWPRALHALSFDRTLVIVILLSTFPHAITYSAHSSKECAKKLVAAKKLGTLVETRVSREFGQMDNI